MLVNDGNVICIVKEINMCLWAFVFDQVALFLNPMSWTTRN